MATQVAVIEQPQQGLPANIADKEVFALRQRQARMFALSPLVPEHLRKGSDEQAVANCYIALTLAEAMGEVPLIVMQNIHVVHGVAGFKTEYKIARANRSGVFKGRIDWIVDRSDKNNLSVTAFAYLADTGERVEFTADMAMAAAEGWTKNNKYKTMPEVMLRYRSASFLIRFYAGDVMLGYQTVDEIEDVGIAIPEKQIPTALTGAMLVSHAAPASEEIVKEATPEVVAVAQDDNSNPFADTPEEVNDGTLADDNPHAEEGPADEQRGESNAEEPAWMAAANGIRGSVAAAKTLKAIENIERDWTNRVMNGVPDEDVIRTIDNEISAKKRALKEA